MRSILDIKRGELTTTQIVLLVILITSFAIILFFIFRLNLQQESVKQICQNSVTLRGNSFLSKDIAPPPLNCRTSYVCITEDGTCDIYNQNTNQWQKMSSYDYRVVVKNQKELYSALAEEMATCWWMFGAGEINYAAKTTLPELYCSICSQINFDDSIQENINKTGIIHKDDFYFNYLAKEKMSGSELTYSQYLFGTNDLKKILESSRVENEQTGKIEQATTFGTINLNDKKNYIVIMGVKSEISAIKIGLLAAGVLTVAVFLAPVGFLVGAIIVAGGGAAGATLLAPVIQGLSGQAFLTPTFVQFGSEEYKSLNCKDIQTLG